MSTEQPSESIWRGREIVDADECDAWRQRVHDGESAAQVAQDVDEWGYSTVHQHIVGDTCSKHGENRVSVAETGTESRGLPIASDDDIAAVRRGLRDALDANYGDTAHVTIQTLRKRRGVDARGQMIGVVVRELADGDPRGEFDVRASNPDAQTGRWDVRYADGGER